MRLVGQFLLSLFVTFIRLFDLSTKIWYLSTQEFKEPAAFYAFIACFITPTIALIVLFFVIKNRYSWKDLKFSLTFIILDPIALNVLFYPVFSAFWKGKQEKLEIFKDLLRLSPIMVNVFQSSPLLIIMIFNEIFNEHWKISTILAVSATSGSFFATLFMFLFPKTENIENKVENVKAEDQEVIKNTESSTFKISNQLGAENISKGEEIRMFEIE
jgi:hypothetical protein